MGYGSLKPVLLWLLFITSDDVDKLCCLRGLILAPAATQTRSEGAEEGQLRLVFGFEEGHAEASPATETEGLSPPAAPSTGRPLSPRQRRAQQHSQRNQREGREAASRPPFTPAPRLPLEESSAGSVVLIVLLTLALAALIFRRIYLANEFKFDYEL
ncbi:hypothetical protein NQZ68_008402 [Dissostichus eleginoides]|nr:hypothetical protein NQZ68_008402 [Dissostichus eleginoides]